MQLKERSSRPVLLGAMLIWLAGYLSVQAPVPTVWSPYSLPTAIPALLIHDLFPSLWLPFLTFPLAAVFVIWSFPLLNLRPRLPLRSIVLFVVLVILSLVFHVGSWPYGIKYQGLHHTVLLVTFNIAAVLLLVGVLLRGRRYPGPYTNLSFHILLFGWVAWCAFPWLGELL
jgi:hypothetical protein